jgi:hypothetical protein
VWVKCARKTKERVTVMLLADSNGNKLDSFVVFKTRPSTKLEVAIENAQSDMALGVSSGAVYLHFSMALNSTVTLPGG